MSTHQKHQESGTYFVTFTCYNWLPLFEAANAYESVYKWFEVLKVKRACVVGYVIMPNHVHCLVHLYDETLSLNKLVANGKRFIAYEIVKNLEQEGKMDVLDKLKKGVQKNERAKGKKHQVFRLSFDARLCITEHMLEQKLDYIHANPVSGKWNLAEDYVSYEHSSAGFYETGENGHFKLTHYKDLGFKFASESSGRDSEGV